MATSHAYDLSVFVLQGGGALGAYQLGVLEGLLQQGSKADWLIGTSIGAINAAIVAGNLPENRIPKLKEFWQTIATPEWSYPMSFHNEHLRRWQNFLSGQWTMFFGQQGFFAPQFFNPCQLFLKGTPDTLSFYDTKPLIATLEKVIDFNILNEKTTRLTLCAVCVEDGEMICFDNTRQIIEPKHIMASGALAPGFPAIKIDGKHYWDGGISSNTPFKIVLKEKIPQKIMCYMVNLFPNEDELPANLLGVMKRKKDIQYASRYHQVLHAFCEIHRLQHKIQKVYERYNKESPSKELSALCDLGHPSALNIVRFQYKNKPYDLFSKDFDFSAQSLKEHYQFGLNDAQTAINNPSWLDLIDDDAGVVLHEF